MPNPTVPNPPMPTEELITLICDDGSDYMDGNHPGYGRGYLDPETNELVLTYEADEDIDPHYASAYRSTTRRFQEVE